MQPQPQAAAANKPGALSPAAVQPSEAAAAGSPAEGQQKQQLLQQYVQRLLVVSDAAVRVESLEQALDLQQRLEDLADNSKWSFPVPPVELLLLVTSRPCQQDAFDSTGLRFFGSAVLKYVVVAGLLQDNIHKVNTFIADLTAAKNLWMANAACEVLRDRHGLADAVGWDSQGFSPAHILSGSRSRSGSSNRSTHSDVGSSAVDGPAGLAASLGLATLAAVYITGSGLFTAGPTNGVSSSNSSAPLMVSAAGMTAAAAFAVTLGLVPACAFEAVAQPNLALVLTAQTAETFTTDMMNKPPAEQSSKGPPGKPFAWGCVPLSPLEPLEVMEEAADHSFKCKALPTLLLAHAGNSRGKRAELLGDALLGVMVKLLLLQRLTQQAQQQQQAAAAGSGSYARPVMFTALLLPLPSVDITCHAVCRR